jgi:hypothetical protein
MRMQLNVASFFCYRAVRLKHIVTSSQAVQTIKDKSLGLKSYNYTNKSHTLHTLH